MVSKRKGIILAGGTGSRLYPSTYATSKQLLPIYNKPMVYYPASVLVNWGITDILVITNPHNVEAYEKVFAHVKSANITVTAQEKPGGIPEAFVIGEDFIGDDPVCLVLGDNFFWGLPEMCPLVHDDQNEAMVFGYKVKNPEAYGVLKFGQHHGKWVVTDVVEKPAEFISPWAVTGLYFYPNNVIQVAKTLKPSGRGELEISDVNQWYCKQNNMKVWYLDKNVIWLDAGTHDALTDATNFVRTIEARTGEVIGELN